MKEFSGEDKRYYHSTCERISGWCLEKADKSDSGDVAWE